VEPSPKAPRTPGNGRSYLVLRFRFSIGSGSPSVGSRPVGSGPVGSGPVESRPVGSPLVGSGPEAVLGLIGSSRPAERPGSSRR
jgi:hypothetical protein